MLPFLMMIMLVSDAASGSVTDLRVKKARLIVSTLYNHPGRANFGPHCPYLIEYHAAIETEGLRKHAVGMEGYEFAAGYSEAWWYSLVYGGANISLECYRRAPGNCMGPFDVKHWPLVRDPLRNARWHVEEMWRAYRRGTRGRDLCEYVMSPARPHDWDREGDGNGMGEFRETDERHRRVIHKAYIDGRLP